MSPSTAMTLGSIKRTTDAFSLIKAEYMSYIDAVKKAI